MWAVEQLTKSYITGHSMQRVLHQGLCRKAQGSLAKASHSGHLYTRGEVTTVTCPCCLSRVRLCLVTSGKFCAGLTKPCLQQSFFRTEIHGQRGAGFCGTLISVLCRGLNPLEMCVHMYICLMYMQKKPHMGCVVCMQFCIHVCIWSARHLAFEFIYSFFH